jgi:hypothetical protein
VSLEDSSGTAASTDRLELPEQNSILDNEAASQTWETPTVAAVAPDQVVARHTLDSGTIHTSDQSSSASNQSDLDTVAPETKYSPKSDWL